VEARAKEDIPWVSITYTSAIAASFLLSYLLLKVEVEISRFAAGMALFGTADA
jgi:hypothetical protein